MKVGSSDIYRSMQLTLLLLMLLPQHSRAVQKYNLIGFKHGGIGLGALALTRLSWAANDWWMYDEGPFAFLRIQLMTIQDSDKSERSGTNVWMDLSHIKMAGRYEDSDEMDRYVYSGEMESTVTSLSLVFDMDKLRYRVNGKYALSINPGLAACRVNAGYRDSDAKYPDWPITQPFAQEFNGGEVFWGFPVFIEVGITRVLYENFRLRFPVRLGSPAVFQFVRAKPGNRPTIQERNFPFPYTGISLAATMEFIW